MRLLHEFDAGDSLYVRRTAGVDQPAATRWPMSLFEFTPTAVVAASAEESLYAEPDADLMTMPVDAKRRLVTFQGRIRGERARVLIDSGSTLDLVSTSLAARLGEEPGPQTAGSHDPKVRLADGSVQACRRMHTALELKIGLYRVERTFHVTSLQTFDVILGKQWLTDFNPRIDWRENSVSVCTAEGTFELKPRRVPRGSTTVEIVDYVRAKRGMRKGQTA